jgi:hypothetical protein
MGGKNSAPAAPDYTPIAQASQAQTDLAAQEFQTQTGLQTDALNWAKQTYADNLAQNQQVINADLTAQQTSQDEANQAQARYQTVYQPLEDQAVTDAETYDSPARRDAAMGAASANVAQANDSQRVAAAQNLESFGIDPSSTRYAALDAGIRANGAAAQAGAANTAGTQVDATAQALRANAINVGRGLPADVNAGNQTAIGAGTGAVNANVATTQTGASTMGTPAQYGSTAVGAINAGTSAVNAWGSTLNQGYQNQLSTYNANQQSSSGLGSLFGTVAGLGTNTLGGTALMAAFAKGGAVPDPGRPAFATNGGSAVPVTASPSRGKAVDDVPARLTPGEFVMPKDAVAWLGEKHFQKLIQKTREERKENSPAQPRLMAVPAPPFRPGQHAMR